MIIELNQNKEEMEDQSYLQGGDMPWEMLTVEDGVAEKIPEECANR